MKRLAFDLETNGLLKAMTLCHSLCVRDVDTGERRSFADQPGYEPIAAGLAYLNEADVLIGHNIIKFDLPALVKLFGWKPRPDVLIFDTMVATRLIWPRDVLLDRDYARAKAGKMPGRLVGNHSLEAWGYRLGEYKGDYAGPWEVWSRDMQDYCEQDVEVTVKLYQRIEHEGTQWDWRQALDLEFQVAIIVARQERRGFAFDMDKARRLWADLADHKERLTKELQATFKPWWTVGEVVTPAKNLTFKDPTRASRVAGCPFTEVTFTEFNPASRDHIAKRLKALYQWEPLEFTKEGKPKVDEDILLAMPYPEAKLLAEYFIVDKRLGQLATGNEAWMRHADEGRIHGSVNTNGAVTGRMTHASPNLAQVPGNNAPFGKRCRELFMASTGLVLIGCDADALELRCLAGYMAAFDGGAYIQTVLEGKKEDGTDMHSINARILGCSRDVAKVWFYAFIYGAGDEKLGIILGFKAGKGAASAGKRSRAKFLAGLPALGAITEKAKQKAKTQGYLKGLDGRKIAARAEHAALNTLLQGAGAILMKQALVILDADLQSSGLDPGTDYEFVANVHDEWQIEALPKHIELIERLAPEAIRKAGIALNFRCPLAGNAGHGPNWAETH